MLPTAPILPRAPAWELQKLPRFDLRRQLGGGSFGAVYEVLDRDRGAKVALKVLRRIEPEEIYRFKREFRALADIAHPNLAELYELGREGERWYFTMELVDGTDLLEFIRADEPQAPRAAPFDEQRLRSALAQLALGLAALHAAGKVHRDIKASNVLVARDGRVVILDFGLTARLTSSAEISRSALVGTPVSLAPEIVAGQPASAASDWYAVGALLHEALTGRAPFEGTLDSILSQKLAREPARASTIVDGVPDDLDRLCAALLARSPGARPTGAEILERTGGSPGAQINLDRRDGPFVGRAAERAALADLAQAVRHDGVTAVALVGGPSGIGKSALLDRLAGDLRRLTPGAVLLAARCYEQESVPFKAIDGLIDPLSRYLKQLPRSLAETMLPRDIGALSRVFPVLEQVEAIARAKAEPAAPRDAHEVRRRAFAALRALLSRLAGHRPLVLFIDDLHWGDRDSGAWLVELLTPPTPPRLLLVAAYRSDEASTSPCLCAALPAIRAMRGDALRVEHIELDALAEGEARSLALALLSRDHPADEATVAAVAREAAGRPFFIREMTALIAAQGPREGATSITVEALVRARAAALPEPAQRLLEIVAVAGRPVDRAAAERAAELGDEAPATHNALRRARLLRRIETADRDDLEAYHDRIREAVRAELSPEQRASCFLRLARALDGTPRADAETLAVYYLEGGDHSRAADLAARAAEEAARTLAFDRAARLYQLTLELRGAEDPRASALREALGEARANEGRGVEAAAAFAAAAVGAPPERAFDLRRRAAEHLLLAGQVAEGKAALDRVFGEVGMSFPATPSRALASAALWFLWLQLRGFRFRERDPREIPASLLGRVDACGTAAKAFSMVDSLLGLHFSLRAVVLALAAGDPRRVFDVVSVMLLFFAAAGGWGRSRIVRRAAETAQELARRLGDPPSLGRLHLLAGVRAAYDGSAAATPDLRAAATALREHCPSASWEMNVVQEFTFQDLLWTGAWRQIAASLPRVLVEARDSGNEHLVRSLGLRFAHVASLLDDDPEGAQQVHRGARGAWWPERFSTLDCFSLYSRTDILLYADRGRGASAHLHVEAKWPELDRSRLSSLDSVAFAALNARGRAALAMAASDAPPDARARALGIAERSARRLGRVDRPIAAALAALLEAGIGVARRAPEARILEVLDRAVHLFAALGAEHYVAAARRRRGELEGGERGRALVAEADAWFVAEGARAPDRLAAMLAPGVWTRS